MGTLKTTNPKIASKLLSQPPVVGFLLSVGFTNTGEALTYQGEIDVARLQTEFEGVTRLLQNTIQSTTTTLKENKPKKKYIDPTNGSGASIKAQMRAKQELKEKTKRQAEKKRRKEPGWEAKLSGANKGAAPSAQGSAEGNAN